MAEDPFVASSSTQHIYRPIPRRNFTINTDPSDSPTDPYPQSTPPAQESSNRSSDFLTQLNARLQGYNLRNGNIQEDGMERAPPRNKSFLNMTGSTLYGIYDDVGSSTAGEQSIAQTPWGTGAETPARQSIDAGTRPSGWENGLGSPDAGARMKTFARRGTTNGYAQQRRKSQASRPQRQGVWKYTVVLAKLSALFLFGVIYGVIVSHLHETRELAAVRVGDVGRESWVYLASWGFAGVALGSLLPYVDLVWDGQKEDSAIEEVDAEKENESSLGEQWNDVVRSVGAFVGIAFAIRRLPWQSTLQLTLTLALVNPALWYILDRSKPGLSFSLIVTSIVTSFIFLSNPDVLPSPALPATTNATQLPTSAHTRVDNELFAGVVSYESLAVVTWVGSVLFCSCVCFGSIGRRLAVLER